VGHPEHTWGTGNPHDSGRRTCLPRPDSKFPIPDTDQFPTFSPVTSSAMHSGSELVAPSRGLAMGGSRTRLGSAERTFATAIVPWPLLRSATGFRPSTKRYDSNSNAFCWSIPWQSVWSSELGGSSIRAVDLTSNRRYEARGRHPKRSPFQPTNETRSPDPFSLTPFLRPFPKS